MEIPIAATPVRSGQAIAREPSGARSTSGATRDGQRVGRVLAAVLEDGVVLAGADGVLVSASDAAVALLGGPERFDAAWAWLAGRLPEPADARPGAALPSEDCAARDLALPGEFGGARVRASVWPLEEEADGGRARLVLLKDLRSIQRLQADLRLALSARRRARLLEDATHDLKAPLNAMALHLDLLRRELRAAGVLEDTAPRLAMLEREVARLHRMAEASMSHVRPPDDRAGRVDLDALVRDVAGLVGPQADAAGVTIELALPPEPVVVPGVRDQLEQVLVNLAVNGLEAMPEGGRLALRLVAVADGAALHVCDEGVGMTEAELRVACRMHHSTKEGGSGLGLYISRTLVEQHGGSLVLSSAPGRGTTVTVTLPSHAPGPREEAPCSTS